MKKKISFLIILISISFFSFSQKIDIRVGGSNLLGKSNFHFSYGFLSDVGFEVSKNFSFYSGFEVNSVKFTQNGIMFSEYGYSGEFSTNHNYTFYCIPLVITYKFISLGKLNFNAKTGILNSFLYHYYHGNPDMFGHSEKVTENGSYMLFGQIGVSIDYEVTDKLGFFLTEQFIGSQYRIADSQAFFNTQFGLIYNLNNR